MPLLWKENKGGGVMKEVFENIKEKIKNQPIEQFVDTNGNWDLVQTVLDCCCEAVDRVKEEYNNGWIPCNEKQPEIRGAYLVTTKVNDFLRVQIMSYDGKAWIGPINTVDYGDVSNRVFAWQPLPETYKG
jgi:hypothetical protein